MTPASPFFFPSWAASPFHNSTDEFPVTHRQRPRGQEVKVMEGRACQGPGAAGAPLLMQLVVVRQRLQVDGTDWFLEPLRHISAFGKESEKRLEELPAAKRLCHLPTACGADGETLSAGGRRGGDLLLLSPGKILPSVKMLEGKQLTPPSQKKTATKLQISIPSCQNVERRKKRGKKPSPF